MKYLHNKRLQKGFTLVELLLATALMSGFLIVLTTIFGSALEMQSENQASSAVSQDGRYILARMSYDVQRASAVTTPASLGGSGSTLAVTISAVSNTYSINSGNLRLVNGSGTNNLNGSATTISALSVQRLGNVGGRDTIRLSFTVTSKVLSAGATESQTFTTTVGRR